MRVRTADWVIGVGLLVSLAGNGHLLARWRTHRAPGAQTEAAAGMPGSRGAARAIALSWRQALPGLRGAASAGAPAPVHLDPCELRQATLAGQIAALEQVRQVRLPPAERFAAAPANPTLTAACAAALATELAKLGPGSDRRDYRVECHDRLCRLTLPKNANGGWLTGFATSEWVGDNLHQVARDADGVLFAQHTPGAVRSSDLLQQALQDFEASGAVEDCQNQLGRGGASEVGTLDAQVTLAPSDEDASSGEATEVVAGGRLAGTPLSNCIDAQFRKALRSQTLPPHYEHASLLAQFPRP